MPSHFGKARNVTEDPEDQAHIPHPRLGFFGVIDERFDSRTARSGRREASRLAFRHDWPSCEDRSGYAARAIQTFIISGQRNIDELPEYLAGWDIALLLFARNESTRFISPTKTPEYLAAGKPVISTSIRDVVRPYGDLKLVEITDTRGRIY